MDSIYLENFRCFHHKQEARMAPVTLLVGANSTGKTSFLALIRALWDIAYEQQRPDFKTEPYDLGSFDEIAHHRGARGGRSEHFEAGFSVDARSHGRLDESFEFTFGKRGVAPVPIRRRLTQGTTWLEETFAANGKPHVMQMGTDKGCWETRGPADETSNRAAELLVDSWLLLSAALRKGSTATSTSVQPLDSSPALVESDIDNLSRLITPRFDLPQRPFASAPVRSKPRRTHDPSGFQADPEGAYIPMLLADMFSHNEDTWQELKAGLETFGRASGLFDEIKIKRLGPRDSEPFQIQVRKFGGRLKGPPRNLIDVGYGVSQVLPVITELLRTDRKTSLYLLQQPEVHLHPSAQAALGSLFCQVASRHRQLVVETHSDYLIDRIRMDVRDGTTSLKPEDVSLLFFELDDLEVNIHSLQIDSEGNIRNAPAGYRRFFLEETHRSLGL